MAPVINIQSCPTFEKTIKLLICKFLCHTQVRFMFRFIYVQVRGKNFSKISLKGSKKLTHVKLHETLFFVFKTRYSVLV